MISRFRFECTALHSSATAIARRLQHDYIGVEHVALALLNDPVYPLPDALKLLGFDAQIMSQKFEKEIGTGKSYVANENVSPRLINILTHAGAESELGPRSILISLLHEGESLFVRFMASEGVDLRRLIQAVDDKETSSASPDATRFAARSSFQQSSSLATSDSRPLPDCQLPNIGAKIEPVVAIPVTFPTPTLDRWGRDLRTLAEQARLCDAIGRDREIEQMIMVLARTQKANPILLGDAGVGKTAIVEALAWRIANSRVPPILRGKRIVEIQMGQLMSGTTLRGQFEERITQIVKEATDAPDVILFIDEIHTVVGAGGDGAQDAAQILKPALARGEIDCIGATTQDEFTHFIRRDPALERRFSPVLIGELSEEATLRVLQVVAPRIAAKHSANGFNLEYDLDALTMAVALTNQYVKERHQPDKSIDAIDTAAARAVIRMLSRVNAADIAAVVSEWTGIPVQSISEDDRTRFSRMEQVLGEKVVGQGAAIGALSQRVRAAMAGVKTTNRPIGVFLFMGPSGVGKTSLAKELASFLFNDANALLRFDMGEYREAHTANNLLGSARGYIGSEQGGALSEGLRRKPYSVVLLDEVEKAHPDVMNIFLGVFDEGRITDNQGRRIDCTNAIFIMTSNIGAGEVDFQQASADELRTLAERFLRRELVNRISDVIGFSPLSETQMAKILDQIIAEKSRLFEAEKGLKIDVDRSAKNALLARGYRPELGARPLERAVDEWLVQPLVDAWFLNKLVPGTIYLTASPDHSTKSGVGIVFSQS